MYVLKIYENQNKPEIRIYNGELTEEVRQQWRRVLKFSRFKYELLEYSEKTLKGGDQKKCQIMKQKSLKE